MSNEQEVIIKMIRACYPIATDVVGAVFFYVYGLGDILGIASEDGAGPERAACVS